MLREVLVKDAAALATINADDLGYELDKQRVQEKNPRISARFVTSFFGRFRRFE